MEIAGWACLGLGALLFAVGFGMSAVAAFRKSRLWGLACLFYPASVVFVVLHWEEAKWAFLTELAGGALMGAGYGLFLMRGVIPEGSGMLL